jgi:hypothetical protein
MSFLSSDDDRQSDGIHKDGRADNDPRGDSGQAKELGAACDAADVTFSSAAISASGLP